MVKNPPSKKTSFNFHRFRAPDVTRDELGRSRGPCAALIIRATGGPVAPPSALDAPGAALENRLGETSGGSVVNENPPT